MRWLIFRLCFATRSSRRFSCRSRWIVRELRVRCCRTASERLRAGRRAAALAHRPAPPGRASSETEGSANAGTAARRAMQITSENVRRLSQPTNDNPLDGAGTGAPGGAGTSRVRRLAMFSDDRQRKICVKQPQNLSFSARSGDLLPPTCGTVPSRARAGTHAVAAASAVSSRSPLPSWPPRRSAAPDPSHSSTSCAARAQDARSRRSRAPPCSASIRSTSSSRARRALSTRCRRSARRCARSARAQGAARRRAPSTRIAQNGSSQSACAQLYEQGNVEPLEVVFGAKSLDEAMSSLDNLQPHHVGRARHVLAQLKSARRRCTRDVARSSQTREAAARSRDAAGAATAAAL